MAPLAGLLAVAACLTPARTPVPDEVLGALVGRAEAARGLSFRAPVPAWSVAPKEVERLLRRELEAGWEDADVRRAERLGIAAGLLPLGTDLRRSLLAFQSEAVAGLYTPIRDQLYIVAAPGRLAAPRAADRAVIVHELVHALQAQHTRLLDVTLGLDDHDDLLFAIGALLEGDALWASFEDLAVHDAIARPPAEAFAATFEQEWSAPAPDDVPRILRDTFLVQYPTGYALAAALRHAGGAAALDDAERDPPLASEMLLHPERYLDPALRKPLAIPVLAPAALGRGCSGTAANSYGELGLRVWALEGGRPRARAEAAADGWDGDRALLLECSAGPVFVWVIDFDAAVDAAEFEREAAVVVAGRAGLVLAREGSRVVISRNLPAEGRAAAFGAPVERHPDLAAYLAAHPEVFERANARRARARR